MHPRAPVRSQQGGRCQTPCWLTHPHVLATGRLALWHPMWIDQRHKTQGLERRLSEGNG